MIVLGVPWSLLFAWIFDADVGEVLKLLAVATGLGLLWEFVYHLWSQRRWDQDFPSGLFLVAGLWEFVPIAIYANRAGLNIGLVAVHFFVLWVAVWLFLQGPIRVLVPRWRFRAGRMW